MKQGNGFREPRISQCLIVKNEENNIEKALSWGKGIVSEQIVVDTGSTDRTVEIAKQMGAAVYEFQWIDDFAAAKNFAISKAKYEWIAFLDADEYFCEADAKKLLGSLGMLQITGTESILTAWVNLNDEGKVTFVGTQRRIFRNLPTIRYSGRIHEALSTTDGHLIDTVDMVEELNIFHTGYGKENSNKKEGRNLKLIQEELKEHPERYDMWGYLGQEYASRDRWQEAIDAFRKSAELMPENMKGLYDTSTSILYFRLLETLANIVEAGEEEVMEVYEKAIEGWPEESEYDYCVGRYYVKRQNWQKAEYHMGRALNLLEKYSNTGKGMILSGEIQKAYELLAICCYNNHHLQECVQLTTVLLQGDPYLMSTAVILLMAFASDHETRMKGMDGAREVLGFLGSNFYNFDSLKDRLFVLRASMAAKYEELIVAVRELFSAEELETVLQALKNS